jgi:hypothetical protein
MSDKTVLPSTIAPKQSTQHEPTKTDRESGITTPTIISKPYTSSYCHGGRADMLSVRHHHVPKLAAQLAHVLKSLIACNWQESVAALVNT